MLIRKADLENHNRNGGHWVVFNKKVYDVQETRYLLFDFFLYYVFFFNIYNIFIIFLFVV